MIIVVVRLLAFARAADRVRPRSDSVAARSVSPILAPSLPAISAMLARSASSSTPISAPRPDSACQGGSWLRRALSRVAAMRLNTQPLPSRAAYSSASVEPAPAARPSLTSWR